jgi:outer membrane protein assembly factor BamD
MRKLLLFLPVLFIVLEGCQSKYVIKPGDTLDVAMSKAMHYYNKKRWTEAASSFETVLSIGRGTATAEQAQFLLAECYEKNGEHLLAASEYERFANNYPKSDRRQEAHFLEARNYYDLSPRYKLDQTDTEKAMEKLQLYITRYPDASRTDSALVMMDDLRNKLARKMYESAKLYQKLKSYQAAAVYFGLTMDRFPESKWAEPALAEQVKAYLLYAVNSVPEKQEERLKLAITSYEKYVQIFPDGKNRRQVEKWFDDARLEMARVKKQQEELKKAQTEL